MDGTVPIGTKRTKQLSLAEVRPKVPPKILEHTNKHQHNTHGTLSADLAIAVVVRNTAFVKLWERTST